MRCLQQSLVEPILKQEIRTLSCDNITDVAYTAHTRCYVESGLCQMPLWDRLRILRVVEFSDIVSLKGMKLIVETEKICRGWKNLDDSLESIESDENSSEKAFLFRIRERADVSLVET